MAGIGGGESRKERKEEGRREEEKIFKYLAFFKVLCGKFQTNADNS